MTKQDKKVADRRIERAYYANCANVQVSVLDIPKIFDEGYAAIEEGVDDKQLAARIVTFVETIRKN